MHYAFQTPDCLYIIVDYINGGDLFFHIKKKGHLSEKEAKFYGA
jgi:serum/glucocorticoid-regulated kinase 2